MRLLVDECVPPEKTPGTFLFPMTPFFEFKRDKLTEYGTTVAFTPLQAADFLAYEILKGCKEMKDRKHNPRWGLQQFIQMPGELGTYDQQNIETLDMSHQVVRPPYNGLRIFTERSLNTGVRDTRAEVVFRGIQAAGREVLTKA
jgi:hypothetical protein